MSITHIGAAGTAASATSSSSFTLTTTSQAVDASSNRFGLLLIAKDNSSTADGDNGEVTSVTGGSGTWSKLAEYTNGNGSAATGVTVSLWLFEPSAGNAIGTAFTVNLASAVVDKAAQFRVFSKAAAQSIRIDPDSTTQYAVEDATFSISSAAFSGLPSQERLYYRGFAKEANSITGASASSGFTALLTNRSRNNAAAVCVGGEFRINTSAGETSAPTVAITGDGANFFAAIEEYTAGGGTPIGIGGETNAALPLAQLQYQAVGRADVGDAALPIQPMQIRTIGQATETGTARPFAGVQIRQIGRADENDTALGASAGGTAISAGVETDLALGLAGMALRPVGTAVEADLATSLVAVQIRAVSAGHEADGGQPLTSRQSLAVGPALEVDAARPIAAMEVRTIGAAAETNMAETIGAMALLGISAAGESDVGLGLAARVTIGIGAGLESDGAGTLINAIATPIGAAVEIDAALALAGSQMIYVPRQTVRHGQQLRNARSSALPAAARPIAAIVPLRPRRIASARPSNFSRGRR